MSAFKDELKRNACSETSVQLEFLKSFDFVVQNIFDDAVNQTYNNIKNEILAKSKSGRTESVGSQKSICGTMSLTVHNCLYLSEKQKYCLQNFRKGGGKDDELSQLFLKKYPDIGFQIGGEYDDKVYFDCDFVSVRKAGFFRSGHRFHITEFAKKFIDALKDKGLTDEIRIDFAYIEVDNKKIFDGDWLKQQPGRHYLPNGKLFIRYSVLF